MDAVSLAPAMMATAVCIVGDTLGALPTVLGNSWLRAGVDSLTHGLVGLLSWSSVVVGRQPLREQILQSLLAGALAMGLDVDHFIMAGSLNLKAALSLPRRPPFHTTTLIPVISMMLWLVPPRIRLMFSLPVELPWLFFVSWLSHHIRDATRQGLWFWPFGATPPLPTWLYLGSTTLLPLLIRLLLVHIVPEHKDLRQMNLTIQHL